MNAEKTLTYFWLSSKSKCPDWNETRIWRVTPPARCINQVSNWYLKTFRNKPGKIHNSQKIIVKIPKILFLQKKELMSYTVGHLCTKFQEFILIFEAMIAKKLVWLTFGCKLSQSDPTVMKLKLDMSCNLLNVCTKFQIEMSMNVERSRENLHRWTDGHCHRMIRPFLKRAYNKKNENNGKSRWKWISK